MTYTSDDWNWAALICISDEIKNKWKIYERVLKNKPELLKWLEPRKDWHDVVPQEQEEKHWKKESNWKISYELDWDFISAMAKRMQTNKGKYPPYNRKKPMDIENLKQALLRHTIEIMKWNYTDIEDNDHLTAICCNCMFIYYQLTNKWTENN